VDVASNTCGAELIYIEFRSLHLIIYNILVLVTQVNCLFNLQYFQIVMSVKLLSYSVTQQLLSNLIFDFQNHLATLILFVICSLNYIVEKCPRKKKCVLNKLTHSYEFLKKLLHIYNKIINSNANFKSIKIGLDRNLCLELNNYYVLQK